MMKRSERLISLTNFFINHPRKLTQLTHFTEAYNASKSSVSEDVNIIHKQFKQEGIGYIVNTAGVSGGVQYIPYFDKAKSKDVITDLCNQLEDPSRVLPGGYVYMSDLLGNPSVVQEIAKAFVTAFHDEKIDAVVTVETKGISLAYAVAQYLQVPVVVIRRNMRVTEGSSVSINYVSGRSHRIQTMILPKRHLEEGMNVCIIDDFIKAGGTVSGMISLLEEFKAKVVGVGIFAEGEDDQEEARMIDNYTSLVKVANMNVKNKQINVTLGNFFNK